MPEPASSTSPRTPHPAIRRIWFAAYLLILLGIAVTTVIRFRLPAYRDAAFWTAIVLWTWMISWSIPGLRILTTLPIMLVAGPILTRDTRMCLPGKIDVLDTLPADLPPQSIASVGSYRAALEREGFRSAGFFRAHAIYTNVRMPPDPGNAAGMLRAPGAPARRSPHVPVASPRQRRRCAIPSLQ